MSERDPVQPSEPAPAAQPPQAPQPPERGEHTATATAVKPSVRPTKAPGPVDRLPPFNVLLHNDDEHDMEFVVRSLVRCASLQPPRAVQAMLEAHEKGVALVATCHRELAELIQERLQSDGLTATIEPAP